MPSPKPMRSFGVVEAISVVEAVTVPLSYADELYALRSHIQMVRRRLHT